MKKELILARSSNELDDDQIDAHLDAILKASGSGIHNYTIKSTVERMRYALRSVFQTFTCYGQDTALESTTKIVLYNKELENRLEEKEKEFRAACSNLSLIKKELELTKNNNKSLGWINVEDKLQEKSGWYAVIVSDPEDIGWDTTVWWRAYFDENECNKCWSNCDPISDFQPVTHWMEIPMPINNEQ